METIRSTRPLLLVLVICTVIPVAAQTYTPPSGPLYQEYFAKMAYFDSIHAFTPDSVFYHEGGEYAEYQKWFRHWVVRAPDGDMDAYDQIIKGYADRQAHVGSGFRSNEDPWLEIGPKRISNNMFGIGPIRHIAISKDNPDHMLCTSNSGGLFHTSDANATCTWHNAGTDTGLPHSGCNWADFYPGSTEKWYTISSYGRISYVGGLYRTGNSGVDWTSIADFNDVGGSTTVMHQFLFDRKLNTQNDHRLFLLTSNGLFITDDPEGQDPQWTEITITVPTSIASYTNFPIDPNVLVYDIEYLASAAPTSTLCASMRFTVEDGTDDPMTIWRFMISMDNGDTWSEVPDQPAIDPSFEWATVETSTASPAKFHCMVEHGSSSWVKTYDTEIGGPAAWVTVASGFNPDFGAGHTFGVDQFNANSLIVGDDDYDVNWYFNGAEVPFPYPSSPRQYSKSSTGHDDVEDMVGDPAHPGIFWAANHGGVSRVNTNVSPRTWEYKCDGLGVAEVWSMSTSQNKPDYIALGLYHDCHMLTRTPYAPAWDPDWSYLNEYGDGTLVIVDHADANVVYQAVQQGSWDRNDNAETTNDANEHWSLTSQYFAEGALNRMHSERLYNTRKAPIPGVDTEIEIERSFDKGTTRVIVSGFTNNIEVNHPDLNNAEQFWWIRSNPANSNYLYVGLQNYDWQQRIFRNSNIDHLNVQTVKDSWEDVPHPRRAPLGSLDPDREPAVADVAFDTEDANTIYLAYQYSSFIDPLGYSGQYANKMVFRMDVSELSVYPANQKFNCDGGYPCADITMNLPNTIADKDCLEFEQGSDGGLYFATEAGVYFTNNKRIAVFDPLNPEDADDLGNTSGWVRLGGSLPHVTSIGLEVNYQINRIRVGTTGRGVWEHGLHCPTNIDIAGTGTYTADEFLEAQGSITSEAIVPATRKVNYRGGTEVHLTPGFHATTGSSFHAFIHPCGLPGNSFHPKSMENNGSTTGSEIGSPSNIHTLELFPNPANGLLWVRCRSLSKEAIGIVRLFDAIGRQVITASMKGPQKQLDVSSLNGLYNVVLETTGSRFHAQVIIQ